MAVSKIRQALPSPATHKEGPLPTKMLDKKFTENGWEARSAKLQKIQGLLGGPACEN